MQTVKWFFLCLVCPLLLVATPVQAGKATDRLNDFFAANGAMRADFVQTVQGAAFSQSRESRGTLMIQRPGKFRWDYKTPYQQLILADGKNLWVYDQDLAQVVVKPLDVVLGDTPALLLSSRGLSANTLQQTYIITELDEPSEGLYWVQLLPRVKESNFQQLRLGFGDRFLRRMELVDGFGQQTRLEFSSFEENVDLPVDSFVFNPPKGVDVVGDPDMGTE